MDAAKQARGVAKTAIGSFAAVGGILLGGSTFSSIGDAEGWRLTAALGGAAWALGWTAIAVWRASFAVFATASSLTSLASDDDVCEAVQDRTEMLKPTPFATLPAFADAYREAFEEYETRAVRAAKLRLKTRRTAAERTELRTLDRELKSLNATIGGASPVVTQILDYGHWFVVDRAMRRALGWIVLAAGMAAIGIVAFVWGANAPKPPADKVTLARPTVVEVTFTQSGREAARVKLGPKCPAAVEPATGQEPVSIRAVATDVGDDTIDVVTVPQADCRPAELTLKSSDATWAPVKSVPVKSP